MLARFKRDLQIAFEARLDAESVERIDTLRAAIGGRRNDEFGFDPDALKIIAPFIGWLYRRYFRVQTFNLSALPEGRVLLIANHSGQLPFDGLMIGTALLLDAEPPRIVRSMVERWVPTLPFISAWFARLGQVTGTRDNCRRLLERDQAILVFPEGVRGISKTFDKAYQLQAFGHGFMRLALETSTPILPIGVVGAEEQAPAIWNLERLGRLLGQPGIPITPTFPLIGPLGLLPYPSRYRIYFGEPMRFEGDPDEDEGSIAAKVQQVRGTIDALLQRGVAEREHVFW